MTSPRPIPNYDTADTATIRRGPRTGILSDIAAERALLGACLLSPKAIDAAAALGVDQTSFVAYAQGGIIWSGIEAAAGNIVGAANWIAKTFGGDTQQIGDTLAALQADCPAASGAASYARIVVDCQHNRHVSTTLERCLNGEFGRWRQLVGELCDEWDTRHAASEGTSIVSDMQSVLDGAAEPVIPAVMPRDDRATCLFYEGINWLSTEPGKGKTLLALWVVAHYLRAGHRCLYLDFEGTEPGTASRLAEMGVTDVSGLDYVRRVDPWDTASLAELRQLVAGRGYTVAVIDAVAGAMEAEDLDYESNRDIEKWVAFIPSLIATAGTAVVCIDHVSKDKEKRGRWPIGGQRKLGRADAAYSLEMRVDAGYGTTGYGRLVVQKDRYGSLMQHCRGGTICEVAITSVGDDETGYDLSVTLGPPLGPDEVRDRFHPTWYMQAVSEQLEQCGPMGKKALREAVGRTSKYVDQAIDTLLKAGHIRALDAKGKAVPYESVLPYRQPVTSDTRYEPDYEPPGEEDEPY